MARNPRYIPPDSLVEITCRTIQGRFLLLPGRDLNAIVIGALANAQRRYGMIVCGLVCLSNHMHVLTQPRNAKQLARFMNLVNSKIAREAGRLHWWREKLWGRRYKSVIVSDEPEAELERLRYLLANGCKEGLVDSPKQWPGATSAKAHTQGWKLSGLWFDRTAEHKARARG
ncbi:MAG: transposase, partial [Acidobacteriota bacterium]|nr:transposase [Acidobacteriota bacterium]